FDGRRQGRPPTSTGTRLFVCVGPRASWPALLSPQHLTRPPLTSAHVWVTPTLIAVTPPSKCTSTGTWLSVVELLPSWPKLFWPQHFTPPPLTRAQVCLSPALIAVTPTIPCTSIGTWLSVVELLPSWP